MNYADEIDPVIFLFTVMCPSLPNPGNGTVTLSGTTPLSSAIYSCNDGFLPVGQVVRLCGNNGEWSGSAPICQGIALIGLQNNNNMDCITFVFYFHS